VYAITDAGRAELAGRSGELADLELEIRESVAELAAEIRADVRGAAIVPVLPSPVYFRFSPPAVPQRSWSAFHPLTAGIIFSTRMTTQASLTTLEALLSQVPLLAGLPAPQLAALAAQVRVDQYERDVIIFRQGDPCDRVWLLRTGEVKIVHQEVDGREVILEMVSAGEVFGGTALFMDEHPATARAMVPAEVVSFSREAYGRLLSLHPPIAQKLIRMLGGRLHSMMGLQILAGERVERRMAHILLKLADRAGRPEPDGVLITLPLSRQDLADMAGTTLETAIRTISRFRAQGWVVTRRGGYLLITGLEQLRQQAEPA
jgi:CRP-like cAMP-binding protein